MKCLKCNVEAIYLGRANCNQSDAFQCPNCKQKIACIHIDKVLLVEGSIKERDNQMTGRCAVCGELISIRRRGEGHVANQAWNN